MASLADQKDLNAKRQKRHRERNATVTDSNAPVTDSNAPVTHRNAPVTVKTYIAEAEAEAEVYTEDKELNNNTPKSPKGELIKIGKTRKELNSDLSEKAETIYSYYPRKVGKTAAIKAIISAMRHESYESLLQTVKTYAEKITWKEPQFIPYPSTWFNEGRFNDDQSEWNESKSTKPRFAGIQEEIELP